MPSLLDYAPAFFKGLLTTALIALAAIIGAALLAAVLGLLRLSPRRALSLSCLATVEVFRGASALVFLFWVHYALPLLPGMPKLDPVVASVLVLSLVGGAYGAEIVRAGVQAVGAGQRDAARALGLPGRQVMVTVILPQALSQIVPAFGSLAADIVKWTSIVSFVGVQDVLHVANSVRSITYETVSVFCALAAAYWALCMATSACFLAIERRLPLNRALRAAHGDGPVPQGASRLAIGLPGAPQ